VSSLSGRRGTHATSLPSFVHWVGEVVLPRWSIIVLCFSKVGWEECGMGGTDRGVLNYTTKTNDESRSSFVIWLPPGFRVNEIMGEKWARSPCILVVWFRSSWASFVSCRGLRRGPCFLCEKRSGGGGVMVLTRGIATLSTNDKC